MVVVSILALVLSLIAFIAHGVVPFSVPLSLLGYPDHLWSYHVVLAGFAVASSWFVWVRARAADVYDVVLGGLALALLLVLQVMPNGVRGHDSLAATLMVVASVMSLGIAQRLGNPWLLRLTLASLGSCSLLFADSMLIMGVVEGIVLGTALVAMNVACGEPAVITGRWMRTNSVSMPRWWRPGMGAGLAWGAFCVLVSGVCGAFPLGGMVGGPMVFIVCGLAGFVAWRQELGLWLRAPLVFGSVALVLWLLGGLREANVQMEVVIPLLCVMFTAFLTMFLIELHQP
jgi:hypothetical protein